MHIFIKSFIREPNGAWRCVAPADVQTSSGRVQVTPGSVFMKGTTFMNIDVAALLDEQQAKDRRAGR